MTQELKARFEELGVYRLNLTPGEWMTMLDGLEKGAVLLLDKRTPRAKITIGWPHQIKALWQTQQNQ